MINNRSAEAGIMGFTYQFLQTVIKIFETEDENTSFTVEGIEDLDISSMNEEELIQYKYHEAKKYTLSIIQKPIALMFKHFIKNYSDQEGWNKKYTLFCYFGIVEKDQKYTDLIKNVDELNKILNYKEAKNILKDSTWSKELETIFLENLIFSEADKFDDAYEKSIDLIKNHFMISKVESEMNYFSNAIFYINKLSIQKKTSDRKITKRRFIEHLTASSSKSEAAIIQRLYGNDKYIALLKNYLDLKNVKKYTTSHVLYLNSINANTYRFIIDLAKNFLVKGARKDIKPLILVINSDKEQVKKLKQNLSKVTVIENLDLIYNDGYEEFYFNFKYFNKKPIIKLNGNRQRVGDLSYNYKLISYETFILHQEKICSDLDNPIHIYAGDLESYKMSENSHVLNNFFINNLSEQEILRLFGGR